jgi:orotate phosphoribosyltransferase-like protein
VTRREELLPEIRRLRDVEGLMWREIGARLGLSLKTVHDYYSDPTNQRHRERHARWAVKDYGTCGDCRGPMSGSAIRRGYTRCGRCRVARWRKVRDRMVEMRRDGMNNVDIAAALDVSVAAVANALCRERKRDPSIPSSPYMRRGGRVAV